MSVPPIERALSFQGTEQYVAIGTAEALGLRGADFTIEAWVNISATRLENNDFTVIGSSTPTTNAGLELSVRNGRPYAGFFNNDTPGNTPLAPNTWYHLAYRYTAATGEQALFVNGVLDASAAPRAVFTGNGPIFIGQSFGSRWFRGSITEVRFWREARTEQQLRANMFCRLRGTEAKLSGYYPLNDGSGDVAKDARTPLDPITGQPLPAASVAANPGVVRGATWIDVNPPLRTAAAGVEPNDVVVAEFDGLTSYITIEDKPALAITEAITVEAWVRPTGSGRSGVSYPLVSKYGSTSGFELRCGAGQCSFVVATNKVPHEAVAFGIDAGAFVHVAGVYDGQIVRVYVNGVLKASSSATGAITPYPDPLNIGRNSYWPNRLFAGRAADVRVWNRARTQAEIQQAMFSRLNGFEPGLAAVWRLEGDAKDASLNQTPATAQVSIRWVRAAAPLPPSGAAAQQAATTVDTEQLARDLAARTLEVIRLTEALASANAQLKDQERMAVAFRNARDTLAGQLAALQKQLAEVQTAADKISEKDARIASLELQLSQLAIEGGAQTTLQDFVKNANDEITKARDELRRRGSVYSLGRVSLDVKMLPGPGGIGLRFPQQDELQALDASHLSGLKLDFESREVQEKPSVPLAPVPSVVGYTEIVARRKLVEANLLIEICYQAVQNVPGGPIQVDRVVDQLPRAGSQVPSGSTITIFIGRES